MTISYISVNLSPPYNWNTVNIYRKKTLTLQTHTETKLNQTKLLLNKFCYIYNHYNIA